MKEATQFAETTQILMNVSEFTDVSQATDTLISAVQAFGYTAETSMDVVDLLNVIGNNYAISTADLAQSLTKSSASLVAAGGDLAEAAALTATANKIIQDADSVGTALKTTSLRLRGTDVKILDEEGLDSEGAVTSKSKLQGKVKALSGVDILTATGEYKSTYEILSEIADVWSTINDMDQAALLELISGKRNSSVIAAILQNPKELKEAFEDANNAQGSALKENEKYLDSIQGKIDQFNNATQSMWSNFLDDDVVKFFVNIGTQLIKWVDNFGLIKTLIMGIGTFLIQKHFKGDLIGGLFGNGISIDSVKKQITDLEEAYARAKEKFSATGSTKDRKAMEDAEANLNAFKKHNQPALDLDAKKTTLNEQLEKLKTEREQLRGDLQVAQDDLVNITTNRVQEDVQDFVEIDTSHIDDQIAGVQEKLDITKQELAEMPSGKKSWDYYKSMGSATPAKDRNNRIDIKKQEIKDLEAELNSLQTQKDEFMSSEIDNVVSDGARAQVDDLTNKIGETDEAIKQTELELKKVEAQANATGNAGQTAGNKIKTGFANGAKAVWKFSKELAKSMAYTLAITAVMEALGNIWNGLTSLFKGVDKSPEALQEKLSELQNELSSVESELSSLESKLESTEERIEDLMSQGSLTFVEQEELNKLKSVSAELKSQIALQETLRQSLQQSTNSASIEATNAYLDTSFMSDKSKTEKQEEAKETGSAIGQVAGTIIGGIVGTIIGGGITLASGGTAAVPGAAIGIAAGSAIAGWIGGEVGSAIAGSSYDSEQTVAEAMDSMLETRAKLKEEQDKALAEKDVEAYNEATEALRTYDTQMSKHISQIQQNYNAMDWELADPETRKEMMEYADWLDKYNISMDTDGAKSNAIARIFGDEAQGNIAKTRDEINKLKENLTKAKKSGKGVDEALAALNNYKINLSDEEVERLRQMGIYLYEVEDYFKDVVKVESEFVDNGLEDVAKDINKITDGLDSLKTAFDEVIEDGVLTAKTILSIKEALGIGTDDTKELTAAWSEYLKVMMSGTATTEEMVEATERLTQAWIEDALQNPDGLNPETKMEYVAQLKVLGVENAEEYVDDLLQKEMVKDLEEGRGLNIEAIRAKFFEENGNDAVTRAWFSDLTQSQLEEYAKKYGIVDSGITEAHKKEIMKRYGVDEEYVNQIIAKINKQADLEQQIADKQKEQDSYDAWYDNGGKGFAAIKQDLDAYADVTNKYNEFSEEAKAFNPLEWGLVGGNYGTTMRNGSTGEEIGIAEFRQLQAQSQAWQAWKTENEERYNEYLELKQKYDELWNEGTSKGYIVDGNIVNPNFQAEIDSLRTELEGIKTEIDKEFTVDIQLQLNLQNKSELVDDIQSVFDTLVNAQKEYDETGYISVDTLQTLLQLEPKYLDLLVDEQGNLNLTKDALYSVARARIIDMGIQSQKNILEKANALASEGTSDALREQIEVMQNANDVGADFVEVEMAKIQAILAEKVAAGELTQAEADAFISGTMSQIEAVQVATQSALDNLNNSLSTSNNTTKQETEDAFKKAMDYWDNRISANQAKYDQIQNDIDWLESQGKMADANYYKDQITLMTEGEESKTAFLNSKLAEAEARMRELEAAGQEGSDSWWEAAQIYNDTLSELDDVRDTVLELQDAIAEVEWSKFEEFNTRLDDITSKLETMRDLIAPDGEQDWFDDEGNWTEKGVAVLGSYVQELEYYKNGLDEASDALDDFNEKSSYEGNEQWYADNYGVHSEQEYYDYLQKLTDEQYKYASAVSDTEQDIADMYESSIDAAEEYIETLIDSYNDYIDSVKSALDAERDYTLWKQSYSPL